MRHAGAEDPSAAVQHWLREREKRVSLHSNPRGM